MPNNFDSVAFMDTLTEGGFSEKQAKALTSAMIQLMDSHLVTRDYLDLRLAQLKSELIQWITQWTFGRRGSPNRRDRRALQAHALIVTIR